MNLGFPPPPFPPFPMEQMHEHELEHEHDDQQAFSFGLNQQFVSSSSSSASCHIFFNSNIQDRSAFYHPQLYQPHHHTQDEFYGYHGGSSYEIENKVQNGLKLSLWKKEDEAVATKDGDGVVKWMAKKGDRIAGEVKKAKMKAAACSPETDVSSSSYNHCNSPIRVCSDCHTTKTPLWRSGPKGPKSLCNACGIRQRKARRAMAAAGGVSDAAAKVKENMGKSGQLKKRCKLVTGAGGGSSNNSGEKKKIGFEDFLINLSNKIAFRRVFPQDEKEAAILLMALSSGLVHG